MINPRHEGKESYDEYPTHRAKHPPIYRDFRDEEARKPTRVKRFRRGLAVIRFPLAPKRAATLLTNRKTWRKALNSFRFFLNEFDKANHQPSYVHSPWTKEATRKFLFKTEWTRAQFVKWAKFYVSYPRKGFNVARQEERILQLFFRINADSSRPISGQQARR